MLAPQNCLKLWIWLATLYMSGEVCLSYQIGSVYFDSNCPSLVLMFCDASVGTLNVYLFSQNYDDAGDLFSSVRSERRQEQGQSWSRFWGVEFQEIQGPGPPHSCPSTCAPPVTLTQPHLRQVKKGKQTWTESRKKVKALQLKLTTKVNLQQWHLRIVAKKESK